jgi:glyoxylase-like metal-dependent hydrolase (beta-lactamase superfamily II)
MAARAAGGVNEVAARERSIDGVAVPSWVRRVRASNPGPMTLTGTNTWLLGTPDAVIVIDPGPDDDRHVGALVEHADVAMVLITHHHADHTGATDALAAATGAPVYAASPHWVRGAGTVLRDGDAIEACGLEVSVLGTPGHSSDSLCFVIRGADAVVVATGDTVLGVGSTVVEHPGGRLDEHLLSLERLGALGPVVAVPGHGPVSASIAARAEAVLAHRGERLNAIRRALEAGAVGLDDVLDAVYADVDAELRGAARLSVAAQLTYLGHALDEG